MNEKCLYKDVCSKTSTPNCSTSCVRYLQMSHLIELSNLPELYRTPVVLHSECAKNDLDSYKFLNQIKNNIVSFVNIGRNLYICSKHCGNAKTSWATKIMLKYFDETWPNSYGCTRGLYVHVPTLLSDLKNFNNQPEYIDRIKEADLVIWDDLATKLNRLSEYEHEKLLILIDNRVSNKKSNIYTSNLTTDLELCDSVGNRLTSRIYNSSEIVELVSSDFRPHKVEEARKGGGKK